MNCKNDYIICTRSYFNLDPQLPYLDLQINIRVLFIHKKHPKYYVCVYMYVCAVSFKTFIRLFCEQGTNQSAFYLKE